MTLLHDANHWQPLSNELVASLTPAQIEWLTNSDSLTKRLRTLTKNAIEHHLLLNDWDDTKTHWMRRMEWRYQQAVWFACEVNIPQTSLCESLTNIGHSSIGDILFQDSSLKRSAFEYQKKGEYYSRRSVFSFKEKPIEVIETFFPKFFENVS